MKTKFKDTKYPKTDGWKRQPYYDEFISDLDISSLRYLAVKKQKDINYYRNTHDLNKEEHAERYKEIQQQFKMITQELHSRQTYNQSNPYEEWYDPETGLVVGEDGQPLYSIAYNEREDGYNYEPYISVEEKEDDETNYTSYPHDFKISWEQWCKEKGLVKDDDNKTG